MRGLGHIELWGLWNLVEGNKNITDSHPDGHLLVWGPHQARGLGRSPLLHPASVILFIIFIVIHNPGGKMQNKSSSILSLSLLYIKMFF